MPDTSLYHQNHAPYIAAVADALFDAGVPIVDSHANPDDPRDGAHALLGHEALLVPAGGGEA